MISKKELSTLRKKVAELFVIRASGYNLDSQRDYPDYELSNQQLYRLIDEGIGGVIFFGGTPLELAYRCKEFQGNAEKSLLFCADIEEGLGQRFKGGTSLVPPMAVGQIFHKDKKTALALARDYGRCIGEEALSCGLNWVLAPVCDVNTNFLNPVINVRAWGDDPNVVAELVCSFHKGLVSKGVLSCAKHFPGHGDSGVDSHIDLPRLNQNISQLEACELLPFKAVIEAGINSVMTGHLLLPQIDPHHPASLSESLVNNLLRKTLGFQGLVVTDALLMQAITQSYGSVEASILAFAAGSDVLLMPENPDEAIEGLLEAFLSKRLPIDRLDESLHRRRNALQITRISDLHQKQKFCAPISESSSSNYFFLGKTLIEKSLQVRHSNTSQLKESSINLIRTDNVLPSSIINKNSPSILIPESLGCKTLLMHSFTFFPWQDDDENPLDLDLVGDGFIFLQLFIRGNPFLANKSINEPWLKAVEQLQKKNRLSGVAIFGSPYFARDLIACLNKSIPFVYSPGQFDFAQKIAIQSLFEPFQGNCDYESKLNKEFTE